MDIPVFHDDQHGTAIIAAAGLINALHLTGRDIASTRLVVNGAGAAGVACDRAAQGHGLRAEQRHPVRHEGRRSTRAAQEGMNQWKSAHAAATSARTLDDAMEGADVVFGLSVKGAFTPAMIRAMAPNPIIFAMANPDPEITAEEVAAIRDDAIMATGRSDYPNQINNVLGFPYIFRGALDVRATTINMEMKIAAAQALADLAREDVPDEVAAAYQGSRPRFGRDYIIPVPFDPRLIHMVPPAVAKAAMDTGVARKRIDDTARLQGASVGAARSRRRHAQPHLRARAQVPETRRLRRGRGGAGHPRRHLLRQPGARHGHPGRPRGAHPRDRRGRRHRSRRTRGRRDPQRPPVAPQPHLRALSLRPAAAAGLPVPRLPAHDQSGPQPLRRLHGGARRCRRHGDGHDPQLLHRAAGRAPRDRRQARPSGHRRVGVPVARAHRSRRGYGHPRDAGRRGNSPRSPSRRPASPAASATIRVWRCSPSRPSAIPRPSGPRR